MMMYGSGMLSLELKIIIAMLLEFCAIPAVFAYQKTTLYKEKRMEAV